MTGRSSQEQAREHAARLEAYLAQTGTLPSRAGKVNVTAIARACGFDRQTIYKNRACRAMVEAAALDQDISFAEGAADDAGDTEATNAMVPASKLREEQRRVAALERRLAEMTARNAALMARLRQQTQIEEDLIMAGRRTRPTAAFPLLEQDLGTE